MKEMVNIIPLGSCPKCGHRQFLVSEQQITNYLTNGDGEIIDSIDIEYDAEGICLNCNTRFKMFSTIEGFIPLTRLREIMLDYTPHIKIDTKLPASNIFNPMEANK